MANQTAVVFLLLCLLGARCVRAARQKQAAARCPESCDAAPDWCATHLPRVGSITVSKCGNSSFTCSCNGGAGVVVLMTEKVCSWNVPLNHVEGGADHARAAPGPERLEGSVGGPPEGSHAPLDKKGAVDCRNARLDTQAMRSGHSDTSETETFESPSAPTFGYGRALSPSETSACGSPGDCNKTGNWPVTKTIILSLSSTWSMVLPNLAVLFLFVVASLMRGDSASDRSFQSTALRKTGLSAVQVARRNQCGLFHSKAIPPRPAQSRCFLKDREGLLRRRGVPAY
uniref:Uncharacterized protein TCIL3000_11_12620 n=1 Tax=Trypanosoma congolense (strain IL3000) TaxID=1068625 RepID=G0V294_TRYCI|nr:unnamed protein product [Trypanosoma congolense IL3000]